MGGPSFVHLVWTAAICGGGSQVYIHINTHTAEQNQYVIMIGTSPTSATVWLSSNLIGLRDLFSIEIVLQTSLRLF